MTKKILFTQRDLDEFRERIKLVLECSVDIEKEKCWYLSAHEICLHYAREYNVTPTVFIGIVSAESPACSWENNLKQAVELIQGKRKGFTTYGNNVKKAVRIFNGELPEDVLGGRKVTAFYDCLLHPHGSDRVCVDTHMFNMLYGRILTKEELGSLNYSGRYDIIEGLIREEARKYGLIGSELQAVLWVTWKGLIGSKTSSY